jgi:hypothetical protein
LEIAQNKPVIAIWEPITFTDLSIVKQYRRKPEAWKPGSGLISCPEPEKTPIILARQETTFGKRG